MERYSRQVLFKEIGEEGQAKIRRSRAVVVGIGALGSASSEMLVRAGVGYLRLVDRDYVDITNLQRQSLFDEKSCEESLPKAFAARERLRSINSDVTVDARVDDLNPDNAEELLGEVDLILDGTDNFETRYLVNDVAIHYQTPWIYAACVGSYGMSFAIRPGVSPCLRCYIEEEPPPGTSPTCDTAGIIAPIVHAVVAFQVAEALKILAGREDALLGSVLSVDVWNGKVDRFRLSKPNQDCPACGQKNFEFFSGKSKSMVTTLCGRNAVQIRPGSEGVVSLDEIAGRLSSLGNVKLTSHLLRFAAEDKEIVLFPDGRAIIHGTDDPAKARGLYARYIGS
jgi:molybdopterin/thiamine biosynthesis adenylyltransferase